MIKFKYISCLKLLKKIYFLKNFKITTVNKVYFSSQVFKSLNNNIDTN